MGRLVKTGVDASSTCSPVLSAIPCAGVLAADTKEQISVHLDDSNLVDSGGSRRQVLTQATRCWSGQHSHWGMSICKTGAFASVMMRQHAKFAACTCRAALL